MTMRFPRPRLLSLRIARKHFPIVSFEEAPIYCIYCLLSLVFCHWAQTHNNTFQLPPHQELLWSIYLDCWFEITRCLWQIWHFDSSLFQSVWEQPDKAGQLGRKSTSGKYIFTDNMLPAGWWAHRAENSCRMVDGHLGGGESNRGGGQSNGLTR